jgi:selenide,water dikinase
VTGFGLLGHVANICRGSQVSARIDASAVPLLGPAVLSLIDQDCIPGGTRTNLETANEVTDWGDTPDRLRVLLADAQTSGPLLLCVPPANVGEVSVVLQRHGALCATTIGTIRESGDTLIHIR